MEPKIDDVISMYLKLRNKKEQLEAQVKDDIKAIKTKMDKIEAFIKRKADTDGVTNYKVNGVGTAFLQTTDYANVSSWDDTLKFIKENDAYEMLERRVAKKAVREYIEENKTVPPGITYGTRVSVNIRRA
jgi:hypothetical protein